MLSVHIVKRLLLLTRVSFENTATIYTRFSYRLFFSDQLNTEATEKQDIMRVSSAVSGAIGISQDVVPGALLFVDNWFIVVHCSPNLLISAQHGELILKVTRERSLDSRILTCKLHRIRQCFVLSSLGLTVQRLCELGS